MFPVIFNVVDIYFLFINNNKLLLFCVWRFYFIIGRLFQCTSMTYFTGWCAKLPSCILLSLLFKELCGVCCFREVCHSHLQICMPILIRVMECPSLINQTPLEMQTIKPIKSTPSTNPQNDPKNSNLHYNLRISIKQMLLILLLINNN